MQDTPIPIDEANVLIVAGPTASGKSSLALSLAEKHDGIIINADSMQIYDALPVLTAQPDIKDKQICPHALYAALSPDETCDAQRWRTLALEEIDKALAQGKMPIIVGGTGFYIKTLTHGLSPMPQISEEARVQAERERKELGAEQFHALVARYDPQTGARLHMNDGQRLIRAREIYIETGTSLSAWQAKPAEKPPADLQFHLSLILPERQTLYERCNRRFDTMINQGVEEEVALLTTAIKRGTVPEDAPITNALGYTQIRDYMAGNVSLDDAVEQAKMITRRYAKRQYTWFKNQHHADTILTP